MLDFRYHVTSLAAVFFALIIGIVVGVGISGRGFVDKSERHKLESRIDKLQARVDELSGENDALRDEQQAGRSFMSDAYPVLMNDRLAGKRIGIVVVGSSAGATGTAAQRSLEDADATTTRYRALKLPVSGAPVRHAARGIAGFTTLPDIGRELAQEWVTGGKTPVADAVAPVLVAEQRGGSDQPVDGVVVIQTGRLRTDAGRRLLEGFYGGLGSSGVPVVAVEQSHEEQTTVPAFRDYGGFSTVDDVDTPSGRLALALLLSGAAPGNYGVKPNVDAPLPKIEQPTGA